MSEPANPQEERCYRCDQPRRHHGVPGPPTPLPTPCSEFVEVPNRDRVYADLRRERLKSQEANREANRYRALLEQARDRINRDLKLMESPAS